jgi:hypothetical protein
VTTTHDVWTDPDLRPLLLEEPELVAIADALAQAEVDTARRRRRSQLLRSSRLVVIAAALAAVVQSR